ncbi:2OG-Fe dioxygenase family protein [Endozoicomonas sp. SM1973]|uniref:2OG-Fe dioxygenase family protein n=1 Tax=Spartinivicinus marinus TaxID=2994442 RepID=A0A853ID39_9GAMM|nr:2OG-Fe dioxygenase family protein [Spartinivicinus marinus]MCX4026266.1 2OG-Fe dioxygenase family protein [Spartinivicinus marinus]NYZ68468.1 2OG-Fe dioxygenase family protein [Spartinivicinus marinus]
MQIDMINGVIGVMEELYNKLDVIDLEGIADIEARVDYSCNTHKLMTITSKKLKALYPYWHEMPRDPYLVGGYRQRCLSRFQYRNNKLYVLEPSVVYQSKKNNRVFGGLSRRFTPLKQELVFHNSFIALVKRFISHLPESPVDKVIWVHQIRINVSSALPGKPVPEGIHRDERLYVGIVVVNKQGVSGEETQLFKSKDEAPIWQQTLAVNQMLMFNDQLLYHNTTDFLTVAPQGGYRDIFILALSELEQGIL